MRLRHVFIVASLVRQLFHRGLVCAHQRFKLSHLLLPGKGVAGQCALAQIGLSQRGRKSLIHFVVRQPLRLPGVGHLLLGDGKRRQRLSRLPRRLVDDRLLPRHECPCSSTMLQKGQVRHGIPGLPAQQHADEHEDAQDPQ